MQTSRLFLDSDVIISSLLSNTGAAHIIVNSNLKKYISNYSVQELDIVIKRKNIQALKYKQTLTKLKTTKLNQKLKSIKTSYNKYVTDINDAHIIAGVHKSKAKYLITYNLKHYNKDLIKKDFNIIIHTPALHLQYLRSQK